MPGPPVASPPGAQPLNVPPPPGTFPVPTAVTPGLPVPPAVSPPPVPAAPPTGVTIPPPPPTGEAPPRDPAIAPGAPGTAPPPPTAAQVIITPPGSGVPRRGRTVYRAGVDQQRLARVDVADADRSTRTCFACATCRKARSCGRAACRRPTTRASMRRRAGSTSRSRVRRPGGRVGRGAACRAAVRRRGPGRLDHPGDRRREHARRRTCDAHIQSRHCHGAVMRRDEGADEPFDEGSPSSNCSSSRRSF